MYYKKTAFVLMLTFIAVYLQAQTPGTLKWSFETGNDIMDSSPAIGTDGTVYVGSYDHILYAINPDGSLKWSYTTEEPITSDPAIGTDGTIYIGSGDYNLYAINPDGSLKWSYTTEGNIGSSPAIGNDGTIYVGSSDDNFYAINPDGSLKWIYTTGGGIPSSPAIGDDGTIYVGSYDYKLYALNPDGSLKWSYETGYWIYSSPAIGSDGTIYVGSADDKLYAINPDGSLKWSHKTGNDINSSPSIGVDGTIYVGLSDSHLYALNPDGSRKWRIRTLLTTPITSSPAIGADSIIYVGSYDFFLHAFKPNGNEEWCFSTGDRISSSPAIGTDGTIYVGSRDNKLYAIYSSSMGLAESPWPKFSQNNQNTGNTVHIAPIVKDLGVSQIQLSDVVPFGSSNTIEISITNYGTQAINNCPVGYQINSESSVNETYTGTINPNSSVNHIFSTNWMPSSTGDYLIKAYTTYAEDENTANDTLTKTVRVEYQNDVGISEILVPSSVGVNRTVTINVELTNDGIQDQSNFPISYKIGSGNWITENFTSTLESQQKDVYSFSETWAPTSLGSYLISVKTELSDDQNTSNDSKQKTVDVSDVQEGWITQFSDTSVSLNSVYFPDTNNGWAVGEDGVILHTNDGGVSWSTQSSGTSVELRSVYFTDINNGWASGEEDGIIIHTNDGGENWSNQYSTNNCYLNGLYFMDANTGYAVGYYASWSGWNLTYYSRILHTTDGGENWSNQLSQKYIRIDDVHFSDQNNGWAVGDRFELWATTYPVAIHTTDGGDNWTTLYFETPGSFDNVFFIDANTGWIVGLDSTIIHTTDGGENWYVQPTGSSCYFQCIYFTDASTGWAVGSRGIIMHTTDGGGHWDAQTSGTSNVLRSVYFTDANTAWAVGYNIILHTKTGGVITGLAENDNRPHILPENFTLSQNYPNPFNARTTIEYQLPKKTHVSLKVYNVHGREILTLVRGQQPQGHYRIRFDSQNLSSGLYFYRLRAGHQILCKRMVILK